MKASLKFIVLTFLLSLLVPIFVIGQASPTMEDLPYDVQRKLKIDAQTIIERIWPKMQQVKHWKCDKYNFGSTTVLSLNQTSSNSKEIKVVITGEFKVDRKGFGCFGGKNISVSYEASGLISLNDGNIYITNLCYFDNSVTGRQSDCIAPAEYNLDGL